MENEILAFAERCTKLVQSHYEANGYTFGVPSVEVQFNKKYARLISYTTFTSNGEKQNQGVYCFVDMNTGNILKAAGYKTPAKGVRGNVLDDANGMNAVSPYGAVYNR